MDIKFANNASSKLVDNIEEDTTVFNILPDTGILFPVLANKTEFFKITVVDPGTGDFEIMNVTDIEGDKLTVERGQEGTLARAFPQNSIVDNRLTAASIDVILNDVEASATTAGRIRVASAEEVEAGTANDAALTPANCGFLKTLPGTIVAFGGQLDEDGFVIDSYTGKSRNDWHACDGTHGTPDLRDKFIMGTGIKYHRGSSGGVDSYTLKAEVGGHALTVEEMPKHSHQYAYIANVPDVGAPLLPDYLCGAEPWEGTRARDGSAGGGKPHTHPITVKTPATTLPPYYVLTYIMKIK